MDTAPMDRRSFIGRIAISAGGGLATSVLPASLLHAGEAASDVISACVATPPCLDSCGDWTLDDMCSAYPGYSYDVRGAGVSEPPLLAGVADVDRMWVA
jgi:hypothetical protein